MKNISINSAPKGSIPAIAVLKYSNQLNDHCQLLAADKHLLLTVNMKNSSINIAPKGRIPASAVLKYSNQQCD